MLSALRSTLEDPSGAATTSGAAQEPSAPVMPQLLLAGAPPVPAYVGCVSDSDCNGDVSLLVRYARVSLEIWLGLAWP